MKDSVFGFKYKNINNFKDKIKKKKLAAIVIEGSRFLNPNKEFVREINRYCKKNNVCLLVDEITSGWRNTVGGVYREFGFKPDIVIYGKGIEMDMQFPVCWEKKYLKYAAKSFIAALLGQKDWALLLQVQLLIF